MKKINIIEYWLTPVNEDLDSLEIFYCDSLEEAEAEYELRKNDYPEAKQWYIEKVTRTYIEDGKLDKELFTAICAK